MVIKSCLTPYFDFIAKENYLECFTTAALGRPVVPEV